MIPKEASPERLKDITETVGAAMPLDWHLSIKAELLSHIAWLTAEKESETRWAKQYSDEAEQLKSVEEYRRASAALSRVKEKHENG